MMAGIDKRVKREQVPDNSQKIERYLRGISPGLFGVLNTDSVEIVKMIPGAYNLNYHVIVNHKGFILRINVEQQSGLCNQIEYEHNVLKFLESHNIAPKAYHFDNTRDHFDFDILIEEYLEGPHLSLEEGQMLDVAELLVRLHSLPLGGMQFMMWRDPLADTYDLVENDLIAYEARKTSEKKVIRLARKLLAKTKTLIHEHRLLFHPDSLTHTDVVCDNFIKTFQGLRLIDWEKPRVDDFTYDICCFLSEPSQLWCSQKVLKPKKREIFLETYSRLSGRKKDLLLEKVRVRLPLVSLHWILWGASKLCDLREHRTVPELMQAHLERVFCYERIAHPDNIEKLLGGEY